MIDLHTHTLFSDGVLIPAELARRAEHGGLRAIAMTDHGDSSNIDFIIPRIVTVAEELSGAMSIRVLPGIEITHVPPALIAGVCSKARSLGARVVVVHGETLVEPVAEGTNRAAIEAGVDILAHPGLILEDDVIAAGKNNVLLEISARPGHAFANGHVAALAKKHGVGLVLNTDSHAPGDLKNIESACRIARGAGLTEDDFKQMQKNAEAFL